MSRFFDPERETDWFGAIFKIAFSMMGFWFLFIFGLVLGFFLLVGVGVFSAATSDPQVQRELNEEQARIWASRMLPGQEVAVSCSSDLTWASCTFSYVEKGSRKILNQECYQGACRLSRTLPGFSQTFPE
jgi:hypothetical protein